MTPERLRDIRGYLSRERARSKYDDDDCPFPLRCDHSTCINDELLAEVDRLQVEVGGLRWIVDHHEPPHEHFARVVTERNAARAEHRQFLADLGSIVAGQPVEPAEALRRVEELVRERETR